MSSRSGSENRRRKFVLQLRVDGEEKALLEQAAKREHVSVPEFLRRNIFSRAGGLQTPVSQKRNPASHNGYDEEADGE
ncbi:DUF1778 domain-containing protein [Mycobacterium sp. 1245852.3]|uniref:type II toxin -antitoxin system TacA 1-like antitoxin n=1 Tax=Mycobacterium sp. 1245852.3 TaxID=1856860 RepID=UPI0012EA9548